MSYDVIKHKNPIHNMYNQRKDFIIVALTGITGSGCSDFANLMASPFSQWTESGIIRKPEMLDKMFKSENKQENVFARKYATCYNVCAKQYKTCFTIIKYRNVLLFCTLKELSNNHTTYSEMINHFIALLSGKFHESYCDKDKFKDNKDEFYTFECDEIRSWGLNEELYNKFREIKENRGLMAAVFFSGLFEDFCAKMFEALKKRNYFAKNYFVHRLGNSIRSTGRSETTADECRKEGNTNMFLVVKTINEIIKGFHTNHPKEQRRFVIDSIRNSLEIMYLRERYNAFYMIALHNDGREREKIAEKVQKYEQNKERVNTICENIATLNLIEAQMSDFENGLFYSPDISRCVTESEIHIEYQGLSDLEKLSDENKKYGTCSFFSYGEQWMKFYSLIMRPGLITPTQDERCMAIAYVAKFNSGCISRQVGCTIVDKDYAVQSVGWNDPPASQMPCGLRYVDEFLDVERSGAVNGYRNERQQYRVYSKFEVEDALEYKRTVKDEGTGKETLVSIGFGFRDCMKNEISEDTINALKEEGLTYPYCFRTRYNNYKGNKDQVNTRSLHAEENTMLRISTTGGIGLKGGTMYVTASPCVLCSKKAYQIGIRDIVYLEPYTDIAPNLILSCGFDIPYLRPFRGAIGSTYYKLYQPFLPYKDELSIWEKQMKVQ